MTLCRYYKSTVVPVPRTNSDTPREIHHVYMYSVGSTTAVFQQLTRKSYLQILHTHLRAISTFPMSTQKAVVHVSEGVSELQSNAPLPKLPGDKWIIVKTKAVALNPTDWKNIAKATSPGAIAGCDYAGVIEEVGKDVGDLKVGDRVAGFVRGGN